MAIDFDEGTPGSLPAVWEEIMEAMDDINVWRSTTVVTLFNTIHTELVAAGLQSFAGNLYTQLASLQSSLNGTIQYLAGLVETVGIELANADNPLNAKTKAYAVEEIITQMWGSGGISNPDEDFDRNVVTATAAAVTGNTGDAVVIAAARRPDGRTNEHAFAEVIDVVCTRDSYSGGATEDSGEQWSIRGEAAASSRFAKDYPLGSGINTTDVSRDPALDQQAANNLLKNSDFEDFTSNTPTGWTIQTGAAGTNVLQENTTKYKGTSALEFVGDVSDTETRIHQTFTYGETSGATTAELKPNTVYLWCARVGKGASISAGSWKLGLAYSSGTYISADDGTENSYTIAHGAIAAAGSWTTISGAFVTPKVFTGQPRFQIETPNGADISDGHSLFMDELIFFEGKRIYNGMYVGICAGATPSLKGDKYTITVANGHEGKYQDFLQISLDMLALDQQFPSDGGGGETIADWS